ncbi:MAG: ABC transporter substrate-binding protein [Gaiellaceae bacterium]
MTRPKSGSEPMLERQMNRRQFLGAAGIGVGTLALTACTGDGDGGGGEATTGTGPTATSGGGGATAKELVMATPGEPPTLFQNLEYQPQGYSIYDGILEFLCKSDPLDPEKGPQPQLAESWEPVGETQWEFKLRQGVKFHNGEDWNAEAAKANLDVLLTIDPPSPVMFRIQPYDSAEVKDEYTLVINTKEPWAMAPVGLSEVQFGAPAALQDMGPQAFAQAPVGTGMFRFAEWRKGQEIVLEKNGDYWGEQALIETLRFRGIPDAASRFAALQAGEIHICEDLQIEDVEKAAGASLVVADTPVAQSVLMTPYIIDAKADGHPTADPRVRLAMNHAIDRQAIIDSVLGGYAKLMSGQVTGDDAFGWNSQLSDYPYDPDRAKALLEEAGHGNGVDLGDFFLGEPGEFLKQQDMFEVLRSQLGEVGIQFTPQVIEYSVFLRKALQEYTLKYWHIGGWQYYPVQDSAFALMWYDTDAFLRTGLGDPNYDKAWRQSNVEFDVDKRRALLEECHQIVHETPGPVFLWQHHKLYGVSPKVQGLTVTPDERIHWNGVSATV